MKQIAPAALAAWIADGGRAKPLLLDVREPWEYQTARIEGSKLVPLGVLCGDDFLSAHARRADLDGGVERAVRKLLPKFKAVQNFWHWQQKK